MFVFKLYKTTVQVQETESELETGSSFSAF